MKNVDDDANVTPAGISPRMMKARPDPTEFQMFGAPGIVVVGVAVIAILYAVLQFFH